MFNWIREILCKWHHKLVYRRDKVGKMSTKNGKLNLPVTLSDPLIIVSESRRFWAARVLRMSMLKAAISSAGMSREFLSLSIDVLESLLLVLWRRRFRVDLLPVTRFGVKTNQEVKKNSLPATEILSKCSFFSWESSSSEYLYSMCWPLSKINASGLTSVKERTMGLRLFGYWAAKSWQSTDDSSSEKTSDRSLTVLSRDSSAVLKTKTNN